MSIQLYHSTAADCSRKIALNYSTSFSLGIRLLGKKHRDAVFSVYGLVRVADEIVDTFHNFNKRELLDEFRTQTYKAIETGISTNPVLHAFQLTASKYNIGADLIDPFFNSMAEDLDSSTHSSTTYSEYIYGSAEVVGLMCLKIFCQGDSAMYDSLKPAARSLGAAFQKVNFLRDMKSDFEDRGRVYFPGVDFTRFSETDKTRIIDDIKKDFALALKGIKKLPNDCRLGVYTAYIYYQKLLEKIAAHPAQNILESRIRIPDSQKIVLLVKSYLKDRSFSNAAM